MTAPAAWPLKERVLDVLTENGPVKARDVYKYLAAYDRIAIDTTLSALMRANRITLTLGAYDLVPPTTLPNMAPRQVAVATAEPPKRLEKLREPASNGAAKQEVAAAADVTRRCEDCMDLLPLANFNKVTRGVGYYKICKACQGKRIKDGVAQNAADDAADAQAGKVVVHAPLMGHQIGPATFVDKDGNPANIDEPRVIVTPTVHIRAGGAPTDDGRLLSYIGRMRGRVFDDVKTENERHAKRIAELDAEIAAVGQLESRFKALATGAA